MLRLAETNGGYFEILLFIATVFGLIAVGFWQLTISQYGNRLSKVLLTSAMPNSSRLSSDNAEDPPNWFGRVVLGLRHHEPFFVSDLDRFEDSVIGLRYRALVFQLFATFAFFCAAISFVVFEAFLEEVGVDLYSAVTIGTT